MNPFYNKLLRAIFKKTIFKRRLFFFISDIMIMSFSISISIWLRFNGEIPSNYKRALPYFILVSLACKLCFLVLFNLYDISWRFVSLRDVVRLAKAMTLGSLTLAMLLYLLRFHPFFLSAPFPRSTLILDFIISSFLIGSLRIAKRVFLEGVREAFKVGRDKPKILIIGAGMAGEQIVRDMLRNHQFLPVGFIDDDPAKRGIKIHGIPVLGGRNEMPPILKSNYIDEILIALPAAHSKEIKSIVELIRETRSGQKIKILPSTTDLIDGKVTLADIQEIKLEDLLGRAPVEINYEAIMRFVENKRILITGAGGSIGSELSRSVLQFRPQKLVVFDIDETELFNLVHKLKFSGAELIPVVGDIKDQNKVESIFGNVRPQVVIHSAAYKHVPILEYYPEEAVKTNILGTKILAETSLRFNVEKFIFISTDKAVNPTSVMGVTKRICEEMLRFMNMRDSTKFISVRFGNVLGSRGSVIPIFKEQIRKREAVTVTHPEMKRYFMITSEAVLLVLEASAVGQGGEVFVLDMGEPVKIVDLAKELIKLSGYKADIDIPIVFTQKRPGEKLHEEILDAEGGTEPTECAKIFKAREAQKVNFETFNRILEQLFSLCSQNCEREELMKLLKKLVPSYKSEERLSLLRIF